MIFLTSFVHAETYQKKDPHPKTSKMLGIEGTKYIDSKYQVEWIKDKEKKKR